MNEVVIISALRTPIGKFQGGLKPLSATELGAQAVRAVFEHAELEAHNIDEVIMGNVIGAGLGQNPARQAALKAGLPPSVSALTINKVCGSGLKAVMLATQAIQTGEADVVVAGGMESMTNAPYLLAKARDGYRLGHGQLLDSIIQDGLWCAFEDWHMGNSAELVANQYQVSREEQDQYAANSHAKAFAAQQQGRFEAEILPVAITQKKGPPLLIKSDESIRADSSYEALAKLKPVFDSQGTVTAGNASSISDGAAALVLTSRTAAAGRKVLARVVAQTVGGVEPKNVLMAPVVAIKKLLQKTGWNVADIDLIEINEAFSVQMVALIRELALDPARVNVNGGAVALGHPIGASGARCLISLVHEMQRREAHKGVVSLCLGGGNAVALAVER